MHFSVVPQLDCMHKKVVLCFFGFFFFFMRLHVGCRFDKMTVKIRSCYFTTVLDSLSENLDYQDDWKMKNFPWLEVCFCASFSIT